MSITKSQFVEAALLRLRAELVEHKAVIDAYLESPLSAIKDDVYFSDIVEHAKALAVAENAYRVIQGTYSPPPQPQVETPENSKPITEEELLKKSATYRKSVKAPPPTKKTKKKSAT